MVMGLIGSMALATAGLAAGLVEVEGPGACPAAAAVEARLAPLLPPPGQRASRRARISRRRDSLLVELLDTSGRLLSARELPAAAPCDDLAAAAAVILGAAWQAAPPPELPPLQLAAPLSLRRPAPPARRPFEVAASAFVSFTGAGGGTAPGGIVEASLAPRGRRLGARLALLGAGEREVPLGPGRALWTRLALGAGPRYGFDKGRFFLGLHAEGLLALTLVRGDGFRESLQSADVDLGLGGGLRVGLRVGPVSPFLGGGVIGWLRPQTLQVAGLEATARLPRFEVLLAGGIALGHFP